MSEFRWTCPHCGRPQVVTESKYDISRDYIRVGETQYGKLLAYSIRTIGCSNDECNDVETIVSIGSPLHDANSNLRGAKGNLFTGRLYPPSSAKPQPNYIPLPVRTDYYESCKIRDLSPKASSTLSRRCLQGMIRDFCGITKSTLFEEINTLKNLLDNGQAPQGVSSDSIDAIDGLRKIGNIGAHMEKDINILADVDPNEAQALIELIESLFDEWYVARDKRQKRFAKVTEVAMQKTEAQKTGKATEEAAKA